MEKGRRLLLMATSKLQGKLNEFNFELTNLLRQVYASLDIYRSQPVEGFKVRQYAPHLISKVMKLEIEKPFDRSRKRSILEVHLGD